MDSVTVMPMSPIKPPLLSLVNWFYGTAWKDRVLIAMYFRKEGKKESRKANI